MTSVKCVQCGFVSARSNEACKRCGAAITAAPGNVRRKVGPKETKVAACIVIAIVALVLGIRFTFSLFGSKNPGPSELASLLSSVEVIKNPVTVQVTTERTDTAKRGDLTEEAFLPKSELAQVLKKLGLATLEVTRNKADKQKCYRFDYKILSNQERNNRSVYDYSDPPITLNPDGYHEKCYDVWNYKTTVTLKDPTTVDKASITERLWTLNNINDPSPDPALASAGGSLERDGSFNSDTVPIGMLEIVEVSDVIVGDRPGIYTMGFKFRFKPNSLGELFDVTSPIHKAMPAEIRKLADESTFDQILSCIAKGIDSDGLTFGHAELTTDDSYRRQWKITNVYFDNRDKTKYTFHRVD